MTIFNDEPKEILTINSSCEGCENLSTYICDGCSRNPNLKDKYRKAKTFKINDYLSLVFAKGLSLILVNGKEFKQCKQLKLNIPINNLEAMAGMKTIDEIADFLDENRSNFQHNRDFDAEIENTYPQITPEDAFWGHCSNLDAWYKEGYNTDILHRSLSFPLLKELYKAGDPQARIIFKEELAKTLNSDYYPRFLFLIDGGYIDYLSSDELDSIAQEIKNPIKRIYLKNYLKKEYNFNYFKPNEGVERLYFHKKENKKLNIIYFYKDGINNIEKEAKIVDFNIFKLNTNWHKLERLEIFL